MSQQLYFSVLRTASPYPVNRIEIRDGTLHVQYEKESKVYNASIKLDKDPKKNQKMLIEFAEKGFESKKDA